MFEVTPLLITYRDTVLEFTCGDRKKTMVKVNSVKAEIWNQDFLNMIQEC
jgi:hypothetical protein